VVLATANRSIAFWFPEEENYLAFAAHTSSPILGICKVAFSAF
jgi:hypothetical protein